MFVNLNYNKGMCMLVDESFFKYVRYIVGNGIVEWMIIWNGNVLKWLVNIIILNYF